MPINTNLNQSPYFDDYDQDKQFNRILFKPGFAVQARELTQLQSILQNQIEQFGDNIFKEGSIVKGCTFNNYEDLKYVKLQVPTTFDPRAYESRVVTEDPTGDVIEVDYVFIMEGQISGLRAQIIKGVKGTNATATPSTFWIKYIDPADPTTTYTQFTGGEPFTITREKYKRGTLAFQGAQQEVVSAVSGNIKVATGSGNVGKAFGIQMSPGIIFQKGHFIFAAEQTLVVETYTDIPADKSVGFQITEAKINALQDDSLFDNAYGSKNENAPGADRLKLTPTLVVKTPTEAAEDSDFFSLIRYQNGNAVGLRDVSQYNILGEEMARRTYEESGNYVLEQFPISSDDRIPEGESNSQVHALVGQGVAYVKGFRVENSGERSIEIDQIASTEIVNNQSIGMQYGHYVDVTGFSGRVDIDWTFVTLQDASNVSIGSAIAVNLTPTRLYLAGVQLTSPISNLDRVSDGQGYISVGNKLKEVSKKPLIFDSSLLGTFEVTDTLIPVREKIQVNHTSGSVTLTANPGEDFNCQQTDLLVIAGNNVQQATSNLVKSNNNSQMDFTIDSAAQNPVHVYYNKRLVGTGGNGADAYNKLERTCWVKTNYTGNATPANTKYNLGFPDVFEIVQIKDAAGADFTNSYRLVTNQKDQFYDLSYIEYIPGRPKPADGVLSINLKVFEVNTSTGSYYFSINSYPNSLDRSDIPVHTSDTGVAYNLQDCLDFRPHCNKESLADYNASTEGSAPTITNGVGITLPSFTTFGPSLIPAIDESVTTDIEYYLKRIDSIVADSYGGISLIKGKEARRPVPPQIEDDKLVIANITLPSYPALSSKAAFEKNARDYSIKIKPTGIKAYRMKDMHALEQKIDNMAYYISLNQLESDTQNLLITDENGLNRFKNGFVVEPFNDLSLSDIGNPEFRAAVPFNQKILTPEVRTFPIDLRYKSATNGSVFPSVDNPEVATLTKNTNVDIITQPYATDFRNCVSNFYKYVGEGIISPPYDAAYDTTTNPVTLEIDLATPFQEFTDTIQRFLPMTDTRVQQIDFERDGGRRGRRGAGFATDQFTTSISEIVVNNNTISAPVGDFVSNFSFEPFMASRDVKLYMSGLRPDTEHYFFFDGVDVNAHICKGSPSDTVSGIERLGAKGVTSVRTDASGNLYAVFNIPAETFYVGDRVLEVADVDTYSSIDSGSTSKGFVTYRAYNFSVEKTALTTSTRAPDFDVNTRTTTRNVTRRVRGRDPIAQTFFIKKGMGQGSNSVFLSEVDVFFKRVSERNGITLQVREVINGYPTNQIVPFSKVHKVPSQLTSSASDDASVATTFAFDAPVRLDVEKEYAIVLQPDASDPNYLAFVSKVGGTDLTPGNSQGSAIVQDWGDGVLFTSTNNQAWSSYQDEDMKFTLRRANFNAPTGILTLTPNNPEFLTVNNITGQFNVGEKIYQDEVAFPVANCSITTGTTIITGGNNLDGVYSAGEYIRLYDSSNPTTVNGVFKIASVDSATQITLESAWGFTQTSLRHVPVTVGELTYLDKLNPEVMYLTGSSATTTRKIVTGAPVIGLDSGKSANTVSIDNINISYMQPFVAKVNDSVSKTTFDGTFVPADNVNITYDLPLQFNNNNHFNEQGVVLHSRSNDPSGSKLFDLKVNMENGSNQTSTPFVDISISKLLAYQYTLSNTAADTSVYISKTVELSADLDAEDLNVILTGYRPTNTDIKVYIKAQSPFDGAALSTVPWTELELFEGVGIFSNKTNIRDYKEFKYRIADANKNAGVYEYTSSNGTFTEFRRFKVKIELLSSNIHNAPTLKDYRAIALT